MSQERGGGDLSPESAKFLATQMTRWKTHSLCCDAGAAQLETYPTCWAHLGPKLVAISSCVLMLSSALTSLSTYLGVYVQSLLELPSPDMAGKG